MTQDQRDAAIRKFRDRWAYKIPSQADYQPEEIMHDDERWGTIWVAVVTGDRVLCVSLEDGSCLGVLDRLAQCPTEVLVHELMRASLEDPR